MTEPVSTPPAVEPAPRKTSLQRIAGVLFSPVETFRDIVGRPDWIVPLIVIIVVSLISVAVILPKLDIEGSVREQLESQEGMTEEQIEQAVAVGSKIGKIGAPIGALFGSAVTLLITAGILLLAMKMFGGNGDFKQAFSVSNYAFMPQVLKSLIFTALVATRDSVTQTEIVSLLKSNLGFLADPQTNGVAFAFLSSLDVFSIWNVILLVIGFSLLSRLSRAKTAMIVVGLWLIIIIVKVGWAAVMTAGGGA